MLKNAESGIVAIYMLLLIEEWNNFLFKYFFEEKEWYNIFLPHFQILF
jgi:hypothetical protein